MRLLAKILLALYLLILLWLILFKFSLNLSSIFAYQTRSLNLIPFAYASQDDIREIIYNFVIFIPAGLLLSVNFKRATFWQKLAFLCFFSVTVEIIQFIFAIGATDITDVITNTSGGFLGLILYALSEKYFDNKKLDQFIVVVGAILLLLFLLLLGVLLFRGVRYHSPHQAVM